MADSYVCSGAVMRCSCGTSQAKLTVLPIRTVFLTGQPLANISDHLSFVNLGAFGRCRSLGFPATASATAAAHGKLTPMPCMHNTPFPWMGGKNDYIIKGDPALLKSSTCQCVWGGTISIVNDGQTDTGMADNNREARETEEEMKARTEEKQQLDADSVLDGIQLALDVAGLAPGVGAIPDLLNASISALRGNWGEAGMSLLAAVPGIGDAATATKLAKKGVKAAKAAKKAEVVAKTANMTQPLNPLKPKPTITIGSSPDNPFSSTPAKNIPETSIVSGKSKNPFAKPYSSQLPIKDKVMKEATGKAVEEYPENSLKEIFKYKGNQPKPKDTGEKIDLSF